MDACKETQDSSYRQSSKRVGRLDLNKLGQILNGIDYTAIRRRRNVYSRLFHEASISHRQGRGMSFTDMLLLLAHHKLIVDREALVSVPPTFYKSFSLLTISQFKGSCCQDRNKQACDGFSQLGSSSVVAENDILTPALLDP